MTAKAKSAQQTRTLGVDIGGSGIKGAIVDVKRGEFLTERYRVATPDGAPPDKVADAVADLVAHFEWSGPMGCTFPAPIKSGVAYTAANVDDGWIGTNVETLLGEKTGGPVVALNDADAAGVAEMRFGEGKGEKGVVMMLTLGTGIGTAIFTEGHLLPNTELGHLKVRGKDAEHRAAARIRKEENLSWQQWAKRLNEYVRYLEALFWPDLFIVGGGVSKKHDKFLPLLKAQARIVPAAMFNNAGIVGAAIMAADRLKAS